MAAPDYEQSRRDEQAGRFFQRLSDPAFCSAIYSEFDGQPEFNPCQVVQVPLAFIDALAELDDYAVRTLLRLMRRIFSYTILPGDATKLRVAMANAGLDPAIHGAWLDRTVLGAGDAPEEQGIHYAPPHPNGERQKARKRKIDRLIERDGSLCGLCGLEVDASTVHMDHHVPRSWGGGSRLENLQLAHGDCNTRKGARLVSRVLATPLRGEDVDGNA